MAAKTSFEDVVILSGAPYTGKSLYYQQNLSGTYQRICPAEIYRENPDFGFRDICLEIFGYIKKDKNVVIEDDNAQPITRQAYFTAIRKKFPKTKMKLMEIIPQYGEVQCEWTQQFVMGDSSQDQMIQNKQADIQKWFLSESAYSSLKESGDGVKIEHRKLPLTVVTNYKLEVPVLFLQWEALNTDLNNTTPVAQLCRNWSEANQCGRVIIVCDGKNVSKGLLSQHEEDFAIKTFMQMVITKVNIPIYVLQVLDLSKAGTFCVPPNPGILAFLQKRHRLDLHCRATQYVYTSSSHKAMAEAAGVQHIKICQVLHRPNLLISGHSSATPRIPDFLKHLVVERDALNEQTAQIPLYELADDMTDGHVEVNLPGGRRETLYAKDVQDVHSYQTDYANYATPVGEEGSHIQNLHHSVQNRSLPRSQSSLPDVPTLSSDSSTCSTAAPPRDLPSWMLGRKQTSSPSLSKSDSTGSTEGRSRSKKTVYIMSEQELLETAKQILKQGGREDLIALLERREEEKESELSSSKSEPCHADRRHQKSSRGAHVSGIKQDDTEDFNQDDMLDVSTLVADISPRKRRTCLDDDTFDLTKGHVPGTPGPSPAKKTHLGNVVPEDSDMADDEMADGADVDEEMDYCSKNEYRDRMDETSRRDHISAVLDIFD